MTQVAGVQSSPLHVNILGDPDPSPYPGIQRKSYAVGNGAGFCLAYDRDGVLRQFEIVSGYQVNPKENKIGVLVTPGIPTMKINVDVSGAGVYNAAGVHVNAAGHLEGNLNLNIGPLDPITNKPTEIWQKCEITGHPLYPLTPFTGAASTGGGTSEDLTVPAGARNFQFRDANGATIGTMELLPPSAKTIHFS